MISERKSEGRLGMLLRDFSGKKTMNWTGKEIDVG